MVSYEDITRTLEERFDWYSARYILREALKAASLSEKPSYDEREVEALATALPAMESRVEGVVARLRSLSAGTLSGSAPGPAVSAAESESPDVDGPTAPVAETDAGEVAEATEGTVTEATVTEEAAAAEHEEPAEGEDADTKGRKGRRKK